MDAQEEVSYRLGKDSDSDRIASIYNEGIADRLATFETNERSPSDVAKWLKGNHPVVVAEYRGRVIAFARAFEYSSRECYSGIAEFSVYVEKSMRSKGVGMSTVKKLIEQCKEVGFWKLTSRVFVENDASRRMLRGLGFREVGVYEKHGNLDGKWRDVVIVEYLIPENL